MVRFSTWYQSAKNHNKNRRTKFIFIRFEFAELFFRIQKQIKMSFNGLRLEYALEGNSNYCMEGQYGGSA